MRRINHLLLATAILAIPLPVAAQVSVDLNALNALNGGALPKPPPGVPTPILHYHHRPHHLARAEREGQHPATSALAAATAPSAGPDSLEHPKNLGASFTSLPALPGSAPPVPAPMPVAPPPALAAKAPAAKPVETASAKANPSTPSKPATSVPATPQLALPSAAPPPPPATTATTPTRLAEATPAPPAAQPTPPNSAPEALPKGADRLTLPFFVQESDLPPAETAMLRDFAQRYGDDAQYTIRAFASPPSGDDDPSTPRRIALARAQSVAAALTASGVQAGRVRLLALGNAGGTPADRVEVIAMPPSSGHTTPDSSP